jgi:TonB family protein
MPRQQVSVGEWFTFAPKGAPFSITLPATPTEKTTEIESGIKARTYDLATGASQYRISWMTDLPEGKQPAEYLGLLLPRAIEDLLKSAKQRGKRRLAKTQEKDITFGRYSGRALVMESASDELDARGYMVGRDFVAFAVMYAKKQEPKLEAWRFLESLSIAEPRRDESQRTGEVSATIAVETKPIALNRPKPDYTDKARDHHVQGVIRLRALVDVRGQVKEVRLDSHLAYGLDDEAVKAARRTRFKPAMKDRQPVEAWIFGEVEFRLDGQF